MSENGKKLIAAMKEAVAVAGGKQSAASITIKGHTYVPQQPWRSLETDPPQGDDCVILFPLISDVGIMYSSSNPEYARINALKQGYTHWMPIPRHPDHDAAKARCEALD